MDKGLQQLCLLSLLVCFVEICSGLSDLTKRHEICPIGYRQVFPAKRCILRMQRQCGFEGTDVCQGHRNEATGVCCTKEPLVFGEVQLPSISRPVNLFCPEGTWQSNPIQYCDPNRIPSHKGSLCGQRASCKGQPGTWEGICCDRFAVASQPPPNPRTEQCPEVKQGYWCKKPVNYCVYGTNKYCHDGLLCCRTSCGTRCI